MLATCYLTWDLPLRVFCKPSETLPKQTNFPFASGYPLETASGVVMGACVHFHSHRCNPSDSEPCSTSACCCSLYEPCCVYNVLFPWYHPSPPAVTWFFLLLCRVPWALRGGIWWRQPILNGIFHGLSLPACYPAEGLCICSHHVGGSFSNDGWARHWWV